MVTRYTNRLQLNEQPCILKYNTEKFIASYSFKAIKHISDILALLIIDLYCTGLLLIA